MSDRADAGRIAADARRGLVEDGVLLTRSGCEELAAAAESAGEDGSIAGPG